MRPVWNPELFSANRARFFSALGSDAALLFGAPHFLRNGDAEFRYRQNSDVYYLTGWESPEVVVLLRPGADQPFTMFVQPRNPEMEVWTGRRFGPEGAIERFGADVAFPYSELAERLPDLLQGYRNLHYRFADDADRDQLVIGALAKARRTARKNGLDVPDAFFDPSRVLHELRLIKQPAEVALMQRAADITGDAHTAAMRMTRPGVHEFELESLIDGTFRKKGGSGAGYTTIVGGGKNATILHYIENASELQDGDLVCVDAGCEYGFYTADVTRTWPVNGRFSPAQRELYEVVLAAQLAAIEQTQPGEAWRTIHARATTVLTEGMVRIGLLEGEVAELIAEDKQKRWFMHGTSHWLGLDVHDVGAYYKNGESRILEAGMVLTIEPGLYIAADDEEAPERFRGIGIRIEDDVLVTTDGNRVLTSGVPKSVDEIEALMGAAARETPTPDARV
jgi:Xaa-Pro aminopeptidase